MATKFGGLRPIRWIGTQSFHPRFAGPTSTPIRFAPDSLGQGIPSAALFVSPGHAMLVGDVLAHAGALVNGSTITQPRFEGESIDYFHLDLGGHDCVLANSAWAESFFEDHNGDSFRFKAGAKTIKRQSAKQCRGPSLIRDEIPLKARSFLSANPTSILGKRQAGALSRVDTYLCPSSLAKLAEYLKKRHLLKNAMFRPGLTSAALSVQPEEKMSTFSIANLTTSRAEGNSGATAFTFTVTRVGSLAQAGTVNWAVTGSGASPANEADFVGGFLPSGRVRFAAGESSQTISVNVAGDTWAEVSETFTVTGVGEDGEVGVVTAMGVIDTDDRQILTPTDGAAGDTFGSSVALSADGRTAIVGSPWEGVGANPYQGTARVMVWDGASWTQRGGALTPADAGWGTTEFGWSVSLSSDGRTAIVGCPGDDVGANANQGSARVFVWDGSNWTQRGGALTPADGAGNEAFGCSVSLSSDGLTAIVGGYRDLVGDNDWQGSARVFAWDGSSWTQRGAALTPADGMANDSFGWSVSLSSDGRTAIVGGPSDGVGANDYQGSARVFVWDGSNWTQRGGALTPLDAEANDGFGCAVSLSSDGLTAIVGGEGDNNHQGSARVFAWDGSNWTQRGGALTAAEGANSDYFGGAVSLSSDGLTAIVGGRYIDSGAISDQGSARVFVWDGSSWTQRGEALTPVDGAARDHFGSSVALSSDGLTAIVGGPDDDVGGNRNQGSARVFVWDGATWIQGVPLATLAIAPGSATQAEGNSGTTPYTFTVTRSGNLIQPGTVNWAVTDFGTNAASAPDFVGGVLPSGMVSFAAGETSKTITVDVVGDNSTEPDEGFTVTLSGASAGLEIGTASATGAIQNDDASVSIAAGSATQAEGSSGTTPYTFTVTRNGYLIQASTVNWAVIGSGASAADFVGGVLPSGTASFAAGETSKTITIAVAADTAVEADETFIVSLSTPSVGTAIGTAVATSTIMNDDARLSIAPAAASRLEGHAGTIALTFTVTRTGNTDGSHTAAYAVTGSGGNPANASDFAGGVIPSGTVSFAAGEASRTVTINVVGDRLQETDETFAVTLSNPSAGATLGTAVAAGTILNDDLPPTGSLSIMRLQASRSEGQAGITPFTFAITRSGDTSGPAWANWAVSAGGVANTVGAIASDFGGALPVGSITFEAGETNKTLTVNVAGDAAVELNESFTVTLSGVPAGVGLGTASTTGLIWNDDAPGTGALAIARASAQKPEGHAGSTAYTFTVTRSGDLSGTASADWAVTGGGVANTVPANAADFAGGILPSGRVSFAAGQAQTSLIVNVAGDRAIELNDSFTVTLAAPQAGVAIDIAAATGVILNDDFTPSGVLSIVGLQADRGEGASGSTAFTFVVTRAGSIAGSASANWAVNGGTATAADFVGGVLPTGTVSFAPGEASQVITLPIAGDTLAEADEGFMIALSGVPAGVTIATATATGTIRDDDPAGTGMLAIARASAQKAEGASGTTPFTFTVTRSGDLSGVAAADWAVSGGSVTGTTPATGADFATGQFPSGRVTFAAGQAMQTVTVNVTADTVAELNECFTVALSNAQTGVALATSSATGVIVNDDFASNASNQTFTGTDAPDVFLLGGGLDSVVAKADLDLFRFLPTAIGPAASNAATLQDFSRVAGEVMDLSAIDAIAGTLANDPFSFIGLAAFNGTPGQVRWQDQGGGTLLIQGNVNNDTVADLTILVKAAGPVDASWFTL